MFQRLENNKRDSQTQTSRFLFETTYYRQKVKVFLAAILTRPISDTELVWSLQTDQGSESLTNMLDIN